MLFFVLILVTVKQSIALNGYNQCYEEKLSLHKHLSDSKETIRQLQRDVLHWKEVCQIQKQDSKEDIVRCEMEVRGLKLQSVERENVFAKLMLGKKNQLDILNTTLDIVLTNLVDFSNGFNETVIESGARGMILEELEEENTELRSTNTALKTKLSNCRLRANKNRRLLKRTRDANKTKLQERLTVLNTEFEKFVNNTRL